MKQLIISNIDPNYPNFEIEYSKKINLYIDSLNGYSSEGYNIFYLREPVEINPMGYSYALDNHKQFDLILTTNKDILDQCPNATKLEFGIAWVFNYGFPEKKFQVSHIAGAKNWTEGHKMRIKILTSQNKFTCPTEFFISHINSGNIPNIHGSKILEDKKEPLFDSQFHICIENSRQAYWFTEKLIDCLVTKTVPIYWGTPFIGEYFNTKGMILVNDIKEIIAACNSLNSESYDTYLPYLEENYQLAQKYITLPNRMKEVIENNLR